MRGSCVREAPVGGRGGNAAAAVISEIRPNNKKTEGIVLDGLTSAVLGLNPT